MLCAAALAASGCGGADSSESDGAVSAAMKAYEAAAADSARLDDGPCIAESLPGYPDWVADIAHDPRQPVDDEAANQCARYRSGEASHYVELTPDGELIRTG